MSKLPPPIHDFVTHAMGLDDPSIIPLPDGPLVPFAEASHSRGFCLYRSEFEGASKVGMPYPSDFMGEGRDEIPNGLFFIGYWGHGINSYRFIYIRKDERSAVHFEMFYGGAYGFSATHIGDFYERYFQMEKTVEDRVEHVLALEGQKTLFRLRLKNGQMREFPNPWFNPDSYSWGQVFDYLTQ